MAALSQQSIAYESAQVANAFAAMSTADRVKYTTTVKPWSQAPGVEYLIAPYGLITGGAVTPAAAAGNNNVDVAALTAMMPAATGASATTGILSVSAAVNQAATRGADAPTAFRITSVTINASGAVAMVAGTGSTAFSTTRGAAGGPPSIPVGSIEIAQIRFTSHTAAPVLASEIFAVVGDSLERYDFPVYSADPIRGEINFSAALPLIHGATATEAATAGKLVYVKASTPVFAEVPRARDWVPAETSYSVSSEAYYDGAIGSSSPALAAASFTCALNDGVTDAMLVKKGQNLLFRFKPDKNRAPYQLTQGILAVARTFGVGASASASVTVAASQESVDFAS